MNIRIYLEKRNVSVATVALIRTWVVDSWTVDDVGDVGGSFNATHFAGIKLDECMVILRVFPFRVHEV